MSDQNALSPDDGYVYKMTAKRRGDFLVINNVDFQPKTKMAERTASDIDAASLVNEFTKLGFNVKHHRNKTCKQMTEIMEKAGKKNYDDADCFACAILTHGDESHLYGTDGIIPAETLFAPLKADKCPSLVKKPKLFFIQACRGVEVDSGITFDEADGGAMSRPVSLPIEADCLYAYSTALGYRSWRNDKEGSCYVQALCKVLSEWGSKREIMAVLTRVNHHVAYEFESFPEELAFRHKKQIPSVVTQLTKRLYFPPKK